MDIAYYATLGVVIAVWFAAVLRVFQINRKCKSRAVVRRIRAYLN